MASAKSPASAHTWRFFRAGGVDQVRLDSAEDILHLDTLDQKLWVALSCPVKGLEFDERTLALLDIDKDGRVRAPEILEAVAWLKRVLGRPAALIEGREALALADIAANTPEGARLLDCAKHVLHSLGRDTKEISVDEATHVSEILTKAEFNGDGVVVPAALKDGAPRKVAEDIVATGGGVLDRSGRMGFDKAMLDAFYTDAVAYAAWYATGARNAKSILPLGGATEAAANAVALVRAKIDDYFARCRLVAFDPRAQAALNREETAYLEIAAQDLSISSDEVAGFPLAAIEAEKPLPLVAAINPAWAAALRVLQEIAVGPLLGKDVVSLTPAQWSAVQQSLAPFETWRASKAGARVEVLGIDRVRAIVAGAERAILEDASASDLAAADRISAIEDVEKLVRLARDFNRLLHNFVNFADFYARDRAIFQAGTLYLDGRSLDLCVQVNDAGKHATLAPMSKCFLAYVDCTRPGEPKMQIAAAFTAGDSDNLFVGRNGLFYDRRGRDWDATIAKIVDNPISIAQAFWSPYKKLLRWIEEQVAKRAAAADDAANTKLQTGATVAGTATTTGMVPALPKKMDIGVLAAISVAIGGIAVVVGKIMEAFFGLGYLMPLGILGLVLLISLPSMVIAWLKLRQRNLGPILDANGWAVNALTKVNIPLGRSLTDTRHIPAGSERSLRDPYAPKASAWPRVILTLLALAALGWGFWRLGYLHTWWPDCPLPRPAVAAPETAAVTPEGAPVDAPTDTTGAEAGG